MTPNNTNYDTLSIYFDFLEDNNFPTEELRESLLFSYNNYYSYGIQNYKVGSIEGYYSEIGAGNCFVYISVGGGNNSINYFNSLSFVGFYSHVNKVGI